MRSINTILDSAAEGGRITSDEAVRLFEEADFLNLAGAADRIRTRLHPDNVISYISRFVTLLPGDAIKREDLMAQTAITYPQVTLNELTGTEIKSVL